MRKLNFQHSRKGLSDCNLSGPFYLYRILRKIFLKIICFYRVTKKTFIDNNTLVASNFHKISIPEILNISPTSSLREITSSFWVCYFITIPRNFICQKKHHYFPNFLLSVMFLVSKFSKKQRLTVISLLFICRFVRLSLFF